MITFLTIAVCVLLVLIIIMFIIMPDEGTRTITKEADPDLLKVYVKDTVYDLLKDPRIIDFDGNLYGGDKTVRGEILEHVKTSTDKYIDDKFKYVLSCQAKYYIEGESFLDGVVERIRKKQV